MAEFSKIADIDRERAFLLLGSAFIGFICFLMVSGLTSYLLTGLLLAFVTRPLYRKLEPGIGKRAAAAAVIAVTVFAAILPFTFIIGAVGGDAADMVSGIDSSTEAVKMVETNIQRLTGETVDVDKQAKEILKKAASYLPSGLSSVLGLLSDIAIGVSIMLFLQFYALKDGKRFVEWTKEFRFIDSERQEMLYSSTKKSVWAVVKGHVAIAFAQGLLAGLGLFIAGVPNVFFWTFVMVLLGFIPVIGSAFVWMPAAFYLAATGNPLNAVFLLVYGVIVVGGSDNFLRPMFVDSEADIHPFFILIGLIGGVGLFGPAGIFLGPVTFGLLKNLLEMLKEKQ
ncbi:MAG: AI-2E family transporter [Candidatus Nanohalobium sp.]